MRFRFLLMTMMWWIMTYSIRFWTNHFMDQFEVFKFRDALGNEVFVTVSYYGDNPDKFEDLDNPRK